MLGREVSSVRTVLLLLLLALSLVPVRGLAFEPGSVDLPALRRMLTMGPVLLVEEGKDGRARMVTGAVFIAAPLERCWSAVADYTAYPLWMPETKEVTVVAEEGPVKTVAYHLEFSFSVITKKIEYVLKETETFPHRIAWERVSGDFSTVNGAWNLVRSDGGTVVYYSTYTDLASMGWILKSLIKEQPGLELAIQGSTALMVLKALKGRIEK